MQIERDDFGVKFIADAIAIDHMLSAQAQVIIKQTNPNIIVLVRASTNNKKKNETPEKYKKAEEL